MKNDETLNKQPHWRCRLCGHSTPLDQSVCSNPSCRADLGIYGEAVTPGQEDDGFRSWKPWEDEGQQREEETRKQEEEAQRSKDEARRQKAEEKRRRAEEKARSKADRQTERPIDSAPDGLMPVLVKIAAGLAAACVLLSLIDMIRWF